MGIDLADHISGRYKPEMDKAKKIARGYKVSTVLQNVLSTAQAVVSEAVEEAWVLPDEEQEDDIFASNAASEVADELASDLASDQASASHVETIQLLQISIFNSFCKENIAMGRVGGVGRRKLPQKRHGGSHIIFSSINTSKVNPPRKGTNPNYSYEFYEFQYLL